MDDEEIFRRRLGLIDLLDELIRSPYAHPDPYDMAMLIGTIRDLLLDIEEKIKYERFRTEDVSRRIEAAQAEAEKKSAT